MWFEEIQPIEFSGLGSSVFQMKGMPFLPIRAVVVLASAGFFSTSLTAAPDFKIRYNSKFPCLEVMDSQAVKITDISEGTKGEVVTSGKASIKLSFLKNATGQPEVTMTEAKSALSEMELEAFGLAVGLKPEGIVTVRFGSDNKPQFEMDRTGGARFLMADLGNLDTAAGKELASGQPGTAAPAGPSKGLTRFRERLAAWKAGNGKGGWSNRPGKVLSCGKQSMITYTGLAPRPLLDGEAIQIGAEVTVGADAPVTLQSGSGVFQKALPGTKFSVAPLEAGQKDVKITLIEGTLQTMVMQPLVAPRMNLLGLGTGVVVQTGDATYQAVKSGTDTRFAVSAGLIRLVEEAGAAQVAQVDMGAVYNWPNPQTPGKLAAGSPEAASLKQLSEDAKRDYLTDMAEDAIKAAAADAEDIIREACSADATLTRLVAVELTEIRPDLYSLIGQTSGIADLPAPAGLPDAAMAFGKKAEPWLRGEPSPLLRPGKILQIEGKVTHNGKTADRTTVFRQGETIKTAGDGRVMFKAGAGVLAEIPPGSEVVLVEMSSDWSGKEFKKSKTFLEAKKGDAYLSVAKEIEGKVVAEVKTPKGTAKAGGQPGAKK
jgi:hypothetical protein